MLVYGQPKNLSKPEFRAFRCSAFMTLHKDRRGPGKYATRAFEGINLGFATDSNTSAYVIYVPESRKVYTTHHEDLTRRHSSFGNNQQWTDMQLKLQTAHLTSWVKIQRRNGKLTTRISRRNTTK
jgi:hypothetical protein